ncbi:hypothetical protein J6590_053685 [Homalodisca vitripennis]|nr:hypothetical protein J6590_053685 [Homalodisca vitripennis]
MQRREPRDLVRGIIGRHHRALLPPSCSPQTTKPCRRHEKSPGSLSEFSCYRGYEFMLWPRSSRESSVSPRQFPSFVKTSTVKMSYSTKWRAKKPSLTQTGDQRLKGDFRTTTNDWAGGLLARTGSLSGYPSKQQPRSTLLDPVILR